MASHGGHVPVAAPAPQPQSTREGVLLPKQHPLTLPAGIPLRIPLPSPRPLLGTPFDASPRYEYPFPTPISPSPMPYHPSALDYHAALVMPIPTLSTMRTSSHSTGVVLPAHPHSASKRIMTQPPRAPPVPPGLAKRRGAADINDPTAKN